MDLRLSRDVGEREFFDFLKKEMAVLSFGFGCCSHPLSFLCLPFKHSPLVRPLLPPARILFPLTEQVTHIGLWNERDCCRDFDFDFLDKHFPAKLHLTTQMRGVNGDSRPPNAFDTKNATASTMASTENRIPQAMVQLGHKEKKDEWVPRQVDVFQRQNVLTPDAVISADSVNSACSAGNYRSPCNCYLKTFLLSINVVLLKIVQQADNRNLFRVHVKKHGKQTDISQFRAHLDALGHVRVGIPSSATLSVPKLTAWDLYIS